MIYPGDVICLPIPQRVTDASGHRRALARELWRARRRLRSEAAEKAGGLPVRFIGVRGRETYAALATYLVFPSAR
jgi:hypothetical protein